MLEISIFSLSHNVFYPSQSKFKFFCQIYFVVSKPFQFGPVYPFNLDQSKTLSFGKDLNSRFRFTKWILAWSKLKALADDRIEVAKMMIFVLTGMKTLREIEKMLVTSIFSISCHVSKGFLNRVVKSHDCVVKSYSVKQIYLVLQYHTQVHNSQHITRGIFSSSSVSYVDSAVITVIYTGWTSKIRGMDHLTTLHQPLFALVQNPGNYRITNTVLWRIHSFLILTCKGQSWPFPKQALVFTCLQYKSLGNILGKGTRGAWVPI